MAGGPGSISVQNDGTIQANSPSGIVGFNGGPYGSVNVTGAGSISAGDEVNAGNLDVATLEPIGEFTTASGSFTGNYTYGNVSITQGSLTGTLQVSVPLPPIPPPTPTPEGYNPFAALFALFQEASLADQTQIDEDSLNAQIGTLIATDTTRGTTYPDNPGSAPLKGGVEFDKMDAPGKPYLPPQNSMLMS